MRRGKTPGKTPEQPCPGAACQSTTGAGGRYTTITSILSIICVPSQNLYTLCLLARSCTGFQPVGVNAKNNLYDIACFEIRMDKPGIRPLLQHRQAVMATATQV
ncbi:hypothetical protein WH50_16855 [Pokkaliibacter plantistimulans]|uniref:Uncharacterized protein n=1 Tax=Pokkaliibacter plantistimulans TaxID=1635171 RepID=A0ABX5LU92_9GAMM|nr:hypothetical protein WH50_16855 [Pokkaliibacter plantistimulans]